MFSATFPREIQRLAQAFMRQYIWIGVGQVGGAVDTVEQNFVITHPREKQRQVVNLLKDNPNDTTLIFVAMKRTAASLVDDLAYKGFNAVAIHGDMEQPDREASLSKFRSGKATFMVATDVCARGLDIPKVTHVINYDLPENIEDYVHRIGRTGRIGRNGYATSLYVTEGNWNNHKILKGIMELFQKSGRDLPDVLQEQADLQGIRLGGKGGGRNKYGGNDHRGGPSRNFKVSNKGGGYQGPSKGKGKGKGGGDRNSGGRNFGGDRDYDRGDRDYDRGNNSKPDIRYGGNNGYNNNGNNGYTNGNSNGFQGSRREAPNFQSNGSWPRGFGGQRSDGPPDRSSWGQQMQAQPRTR